jgi:hypothetical protein
MHQQLIVSTRIDMIKPTPSGGCKWRMRRLTNTMADLLLPGLVLLCSSSSMLIAQSTSGLIETNVIKLHESFGFFDVCSGYQP